MIEQNIIEWLELGDSIQKLNIYSKKSVYFFIINYLLSQYSNFSEAFYLFIYLLFFLQIIELNIIQIDITGDSIIKIIKYLEDFILFHKITNYSNISYISLLVCTIVLYLFSILFSIISLLLYLKNQKKNRLLITINSVINLLNVYFLHGPAILILCSKFFCHNEGKTYLCPVTGGIWKIVLIIVIFLYIIIVICGVYISTLYINDIGSINEMGIRCKINNNYTPIIISIKLIYFIMYYFIEQFVNTSNIIILLYNIFLMLSNGFISVYTYKELFYYNNFVNALFHYGWKYTTWFSVCIFMKNICKIKDITLFVVFGVLIITMALYFNNKNRNFELITEFNIFEGNDIKSIQKFNHILLNMFRNGDQKSKILISGVIKRFEEYISSNIELFKQYNKLLNDQHLQNKFSNDNELTILSIISIIYSYNIEKSKEVADMTLNMCYFLINGFKNPAYAIWLCTKLKSCTNTQSYYRYVLMEQIKDLLTSKIKKNSQKISIKNVQISSAILYHQYVELFKIKIYDATCSQIEFFDILRNKIATEKTVDNYLRVGEDVLSLRNEVLNLWNRIIILNPFSDESEKDFLLYVSSVLQDDILVKNELKKFSALQAEKFSEKDNIYYAMFNQEISAVLLADGYTYNGKIVYTTPNFPFLFMFSEKEIINTSIDDFLPDAVQSFHKYLIEDSIKSSNLAYIFKDQRDSLIKGKNGIIFNISLFIKPVPNLSYGLVYFISLKKNLDQNFILILDNNFIINGFTEINRVNSSFIFSNNYDLSYLINGHHIGLIIPDILLYINYDVKTNSFSLPSNKIELKGYLYPTSNFKDLDEKIPEIFEEIKKRIIAENNQNKVGVFETYEELIKMLKKNNPKSYSIYFRIESHKFIGGKYMYYRIYITNDLLTADENFLKMNSESKVLSIKKSKNTKDFLKHTIFSKINIKELSAENESKSNRKELKLDNRSYLDYQKSKNNRSINEISKNNNNDIYYSYNSKIIKLQKEKSQNMNFNINKNNLKQLSSINNNKNFDLFSTSSISPLIQTNAEPIVFNKIKRNVIKKIDCVQVKRMRYLAYIFIPINIALIIFDYYYSMSIIDRTIEYLEENKYFDNLKVSTACIYISALNLRMVKKGYIHRTVCPNNNCTKYYHDNLENCLIKIKIQKFGVYSLYEEYQEMFKQKIKISLFYDNTTETNDVNLDMNNCLKMIIAHAIKILTFLRGKSIGSKESEEDIEVYLRNLLTNSLKFFKSDYRRFIGSEKEEKSKKAAFHVPISISIYIVFLLFTSYIYYSYIILTKNIHIFYFDKLMNFTSIRFESYLKKLDEVKKKFREDTNDDDEKNYDDFEFDDKNEFNSKKVTEETSKKEDNRNVKKKKQNKIIQQKIKNKRIISDYLWKKSIFLIIKFGIIFILSIAYYIVTIIITLKMKNNYLFFDNIIENIDKLYCDYFYIFLNFKEQIEILEKTGNKSNFLIQNDVDIERPKFGDSLVYIIRSSKYSEENLAIFEALYNDNACQVLTDNEAEYEICKNVFSSFLSKGFEQSVVHINDIITNVIDELNSLKENKNLYEIYEDSTLTSQYEVFMEYYMIVAFFKTQNMFQNFKSDEKNYINNLIRIDLIIFSIIYIIIFIFLLVYVYSYKDFTSSFLCFIGIIPSRYMADDNEFYQQVIALDPYYE